MTPIGPTCSYSLLRFPLDAPHPSLSLPMRGCLCLVYPHQWPIPRLPHLLPDPLFQLPFILRNPLLRCNPFLNSLLDNRRGDLNAYFSDVCDVGNKAGVGVMEAGGLGGEGSNGCDEHGRGQEVAAREHSAETDPGECGGIVAFGLIDQ